MAQSNKSDSIFATQSKQQPTNGVNFMQNDVLKNLLPKDRKNKQDQLLSFVPAVEAIGNKALKQALKSDKKNNDGIAWSDDLYWAIQNSLVERGVLEKGKGNGGSVKRVLQFNELVDKTSIDYKKERELYDPIATELENVWAKDQGFDRYYVKNTAEQGSKYTKGKWTRPDIIVVGCKTFPYIPGKFLDVITFEVKPYEAIDISGIYEALAHRRAATRSYLIVHIPTNKHFNTVDIENEAGKFGIGLIVARDPIDYDTWEVLLEAQRIEPDPYKLNDFIAQQVSAELKEQIEKWVGNTNEKEDISNLV